MFISFANLIFFLNVFRSLIQNIIIELFLIIYIFIFRNFTVYDLFNQFYIPSYHIQTKKNLLNFERLCLTFTHRHMRSISLADRLPHSICAFPSLSVSSLLKSVTMPVTTAVQLRICRSFLLSQVINAEISLT